MKVNLRQKPDGIAIFIVMISIIAIGFMAGIFAAKMKVETQLALNSNNEDKYEWGARYGIEHCRYVLAMEMLQPGPAQRHDALNQAWNHGVSETNDLLISLASADIQVDDDVRIHWDLADAERKLNINGYVNNEPLMTQSLIQMGVDASDIPTIISSIQDWIDVDTDTHANGAESDYYATLNPPYNAKDGPIDDLSELLLVKGVTPDIYWGPNSTNHQPSMFQHNGLLPNTPVAAVGMVDVFTPISSGLVNINTCSTNTLEILGIDGSSAQRIVDLRDETPFDSPGEIINAGLPQQLVQQFLPYLTVRSSTWEVKIVVYVGASPPRTYHALLRRNSPREIQILEMWWD